MGKIHCHAHFSITIDRNFIGAGISPRERERESSGFISLNESVRENQRASLQFSASTTI